MSDIKLTYQNTMRVGVAVAENGAAEKSAALNGYNYWFIEDDVTVYDLNGKQVGTVDDIGRGESALGLLKEIASKKSLRERHDNTTGRCSGCGAIHWCGDGKPKDPCKDGCLWTRVDEEISKLEAIT